jgi:hypothetical protein
MQTPHSIYQTQRKIPSYPLLNYHDYKETFFSLINTCASKEYLEAMCRFSLLIDSKSQSEKLSLKAKRKKCFYSYFSYSRTAETPEKMKMLRYLAEKNFLPAMVQYNRFYEQALHQHRYYQNIIDQNKYWLTKSAYLVRKAALRGDPFYIVEYYQVKCDYLNRKERENLIKELNQRLLNIDIDDSSFWIDPFRKLLPQLLKISIELKRNAVFKGKPIGGFLSYIDSFNSST